MSTENIEQTTMNEMMEQIDETIGNIRSGDIVKGKVISVNDNEVMINIGYMSDGIITREELSNDKEVNPIDIINEGDEIDVYILKMNDGEGNVLLSKKRADMVKIWDELENASKNDSIFEVKVNEVVKGGAIAMVEGVRAFIPASQLSNSYVKDLNKFVGKDLKVKVIEFDREKRKVVLSRRVVEKEELEANKQKVLQSLKKGERRTGVVSRLAKFGAFVDLGGVDGLIHISQLSWERVNNPSEVVSEGDEVEVYVLDFDRESGKISLALKDINENPWNKAIKELKVNDIIEGKVVRLLDFGAFVEVKPGVEGLVHISEISEERISKPSEKLKVGDKVKVKILEIKEDAQKISLSIKEAESNSSEEIAKYVDKEEASTTIGDLFADKLKNFKFE